MKQSSRTRDLIEVEPTICGVLTLLDDLAVRSGRCARYARSTFCEDASGHLETCEKAGSQAAAAFDTLSTLVGESVTRDCNDWSTGRINGDEAMARGNGKGGAAKRCGAYADAAACFMDAGHGMAAFHASLSACLAASA